MDHAQFKEKFGFEPDQDELDRVNCRFSTHPGHHDCGVCGTCNNPRFMCDCPKKAAECRLSAPHLMVPTVHSNGTSKAELLQRVLDALGAVRAGKHALHAAAPHGRDYYVQSDGALDAAVAEHRHRCDKLTAVLFELETLAEEISDQGNP